jgi:hypothetical protein
MSTVVVDDRGASVEELASQGQRHRFAQGRRHGIAHLTVLAGAPAGERRSGGEALKQRRFLDGDAPGAGHLSLARRAAGQEVGVVLGDDAKSVQPGGLVTPHAGQEGGRRTA